MKPPAPFSAETSIDTARMPLGNTAARKPEPFANTTAGSRIGSPLATGMRTTAPTNCCIASGRSVFFTKLAVADDLRPELPADIAFADQLTATEVVLGDQNLDGRERRQRRRRSRRRLVVAARQIGRNPASGESDTEYNETRGFHYASLPT